MIMTQYDVRTNTIRSSVFGFFFKIVNIVGAFVVRTMLIQRLGVEYVGLDGLFSSILKLLSLAEMGFSSAIVYKLYKPIADGDIQRVNALLSYYRKVYTWVGGFVLLAGITMLPFLSDIITGDVPCGINIYVLYSIYLANTVISYWLFAYKSAIMAAHQRNDLVSKVYTSIYILKYILQISLLIIFPNYYVFTFVIPLTTALTNIGVAFMANKYFPEYKCCGSIGKDDRTEIVTKVSSLLYNKVGVAIINGSDNIVISKFLGLSVLGIYDSYYYIFSMLYSMLDIIHVSLTGGVGNRIVTHTVTENFDMFKKLNFYNMWLVGWMSITLVSLYQPFMKIWIGEEKVFDEKYAMLMGIYFCLYMNRFVTLIYKNAIGLWREDRFRALIEAIVNLILNLIMVQFIGIYGITLSTVIAMVVVSIPWETKTLFQHYFKNGGERGFFMTQIGGFIITIANAVITYCCCSLISNNGILACAGKMIICLLIPNTFYLLAYSHNRYLSEALAAVQKKIKKRNEGKIDV